jgi:hypothetical protein
LVKQLGGIERRRARRRRRRRRRRRESSSRTLFIVRSVSPLSDTSSSD